MMGTYLDASVPEDAADFHPFLEEAVEVFGSKGHDVDVDFRAPYRCRCFHARFGDGEDAVDAEGDAYAWDLRFAGEHAY